MPLFGMYAITGNRTHRKTRDVCATHAVGAPAHLSNHTKNQTFEIVGFGHGEQDGMIPRLGAALDDGNRPVSIHSGGGDDFQEICLAHMVGARARHQKAAGIEDLERAQIQFLIRPQRRFSMRSLPGERGRIEHDSVKPHPLAVCRFEKIKTIHFAPLDIVRPIKRLIGLGRN